MTTLISDIIRDRAEHGMADLLLSLYDAGYCHGAGIAMVEPLPPGMRELITTIAARHQAEILALRDRTDPPLLRDDIPGWLFAQQPFDKLRTAQIDPVRTQAAAEREAALGDATPPEGWGTLCGVCALREREARS